MSKKTLLLAVVIAALSIGGCTRPEGGWRDRVQDQAQPTPTEPVWTAEPEEAVSDEVDEFLNELEFLLNDLDASLAGENEWQLDVPQDPGDQSQNEEEAEAVADLLAELENSLLSLDSALGQEGAQQIDLP